MKDQGESERTLSASYPAPEIRELGAVQVLTQTIPVKHLGRADGVIFQSGSVSSAS